MLREPDRVIEKHGNAEEEVEKVMIVSEEGEEIRLKIA